VAVEDSMPRRNAQRKHGTARGSLRCTSTARASRINRQAVKSGCACEWDGWGRLSEDGLGQQNPDRSEGLWGRGADSSNGGASPSLSSRHRAGHKMRPRSARRADANLRDAQGMLGAGLTCATRGKALLETPTFQPYWGKPAVRMIGGTVETAASFEARFAPRSYPTS
jgi:hypothetical protein